MRRWWLFLLSIAAAAPASCSAGSSGTPPETFRGRPADARLKASSAYCVTNSCMYVLAFYKTQAYSTILAFPSGAKGHGNVPMQAIGGPDTGMGYAGGVAVDLQRNVYASNYSTNSITVYAPGADGDAAPIRTIVGPDTGLNTPFGMAVDAAGNLYVANLTTPPEASITVYAPGADGDAVPIRKIIGAETGLREPSDVAVSASGEVFVLNYNDEEFQSITVYTARASGDAKPIQMITGNETGLSLATSMAIDSHENIYVVNDSSSKSGFYNNVTVYSAGAGGDAAPTDVVAGSSTRLNGSWAVAIDAADELYVTNDYDCQCRAGEVVVFPYGANGNADPARVTSSRPAMSHLRGLTIR